MSEGPPRATDITWHRPRLTREDHELRLGQRGCLLWFTGLSGSGKSTVANLVAHALHVRGAASYLLDGDNLRFGLNADLGFSAEDRRENVRRLAEVGALLVDAGLITLVAAIAPFAADRARARERVPAQRFVEVFVDAPLAECERRDPKGLYAKARAGELRGFTGIDAPYEAPTAPELHLRTDQGDPAALAAQVLEHLDGHGWLPPRPVGA
jgi:adenylyl-sulfate kinase